MQWKVYSFLTTTIEQHPPEDHVIQKKSFMAGAKCVVFGCFVNKLLTIFI